MLQVCTRVRPACLCLPLHVLRKGPTRLPPLSPAVDLRQSGLPAYALPVPLIADLRESQTYLAQLPLTHLHMSLIHLPPLPRLADLRKSQLHLHCKLSARG